MAYDIVIRDDRYLIINEGSFPILNEVTPNLEANEHMLVALMAKNCPLKQKKACVGLDRELTSICKFLKFYPEMGKPIPCNYGDSFTEREFGFYKSEPPCEKIKRVFIPSRNKSEKSHAYVLCGD